MGNDPGEVKKEIRATARAAEKERQNTFEVAAREWFASYSPALTPKHAAKLQRYTGGLTDKRTRQRFHLATKLELVC
ncbi:hypothetical protein [uncultured Desulfovibrio sp.]|uniref:hypothetical protein n=1 Tax=uncultured Desulfovibrio sp. TaxID=167968 RepID=UPI00261ADAE4|nr:hypothetical protein [uncultured Desulfovibrio sp.]